MKLDRVVIVHRRTPVDELLEAHGTYGQAEFFLGSRGESIAEYAAASGRVQAALDEVRSSVPRAVAQVSVERRDIPTFLFRPTDVVIVCGPDGLFVNLATHLDGQPVLAVNPDPARVDGVIMSHSPGAVSRKLAQVAAGAFTVQGVTLARASLNDGRVLYAANDFLIGRADQASARYVVRWGGREERQSSSGILVSTGLGCSGWRKSILTMAAALAGTKPPTTPTREQWSQPSLPFIVREAFATGYTGAKLHGGEVRRGRELVVTSEMPEGGAITVDGLTSQAASFNSGAVVTVAVADRAVSLIN